ncbi:MAG: portal protein [Candidatus Omnitrophota bacterium]|jgi:hypothetical protein
MAADVKQIILDNTYLSNQNSNWRSYHQALASFCLPRKAWIDSIRPIGDRLKLGHLFDSTAMRSLRIMAAGFHSNLTNPAERWCGIEAVEAELMKSYEVKRWFYDTSERIYSVLNGSNFDTTIQEFYTSEGCFGTSCVSNFEDDDTTIRYGEIPIEQINIEDDMQGRTIAVYRNFKLTAIKAYIEWGQDAGKSVLEVYKDKPFTEFEFLHYVGPRYRRDVAKKDNLNMPFQSVWIAKKDSHLIRESGFTDFPYVVGRFYKDSSDPFGFSPAMDAFPDITGVNAQKKTLIKAGMKHAAPAYDAPSSGYLMPLNFNPDAINYRDPKMAPDQMLRALPTGTGNLPITYEIIKGVQDEIKDHFFVPVFQSLSMVTKQMTVPEVQKRMSESMALLGGVVGRFTNEVHSPLIIRLFNLMYRNKMLAEMPAILQGKQFRVIYLSPLAKAQRESSLYSLDNFLTRVGQIAAVKPDALDKIDEDKTIDEIAKIEGINPEVIRDDKSVGEIRKRRQEATEMLQKIQMAQGGADVMKTGAEAKKAGVEAQAAKQ